MRNHSKATAAVLLAVAPVLSWSADWSFRCQEATASEFSSVITGPMTVSFREADKVLTFQRTQPGGELKLDVFEVSRFKYPDQSSFAASLELKRPSGFTEKATYYFFFRDPTLSIEYGTIDADGFFTGASRPAPGKQCVRR